MESTSTKTASNVTQIPGSENATKEKPDAASLLYETEQEEEADKILFEMDENYISPVTPGGEEDDNDDEHDDDDDIIDTMI